MVAVLPLPAGPVGRNLMPTLCGNRGAALRRKGGDTAINAAYVARLKSRYAEEGRALLDEGVAPALIANATRHAGFAASPLPAGARGEQAGGAQAAASGQARAIGERLLTLLALEAVRCLEEGVVAQPVEADLGAVLGVGYPDWTGGTLSYIETVGLADFVGRCDDLAACHGDRLRPTPGLRHRAQAAQLFYDMGQGS